MTDQPKPQAEDNETSNFQFKDFIETNQQYLKQKYYDHFFPKGQQNKNKISINQIPLNNLFSYILEIFSLQRYQQNSKLSNKIKQSVKENVNQYLKQTNDNKINQSNQFDFDILKDLLLYIVKTNSIFSIQYQTKNSNQSQEINKNSNKKQLSFQVQLNLTGQMRRNSDQIIDDNFYIVPKKSKLQNSFSLLNQFSLSSQTNPQNQVLNEQKLIKKNIKALFDFYCRQQMELGGLITFDRLNEQTSSMSLGKCLTFAKATKIYNHLIKRDDLVSKFKKISEGKKYINHQTFQKLMDQFQAIDSYFYQRIGLASEDIRKKLKYVKLPFNTKDVLPRQKIAVRNFLSKLTEHSGQTSQELKIQLQQKKKQLMNIKRLKQFKEYMQFKQSRPQLIKQTDLKAAKTPKNKDLSLQLSFIGSIIHPEDDDETYLKDHVIPRLQKQTQKIPKFAHVFETQRYRSHDKLTLRKHSVVSDIRKRITEIESSEKLSLASKINLSQRLVQSPKKRYTPT